MVDFLRNDWPETRGPSSASIRRDQRAWRWTHLLASFFAYMILGCQLSEFAWSEKWNLLAIESICACAAVLDYTLCSVLVSIRIGKRLRTFFLVFTFGSVPKVCNAVYRDITWRGVRIPYDLCEHRNYCIMYCSGCWTSHCFVLNQIYMPSTLRPAYQSPSHAGWVKAGIHGVRHEERRQTLQTNKRSSELESR